MDIRSEREGSELKVWLEGDVCAACVPETEAFLNANIGGINRLIVDFGGVKRLTKEGLMLLLSTRKKLVGGEMALVNVPDGICDELEESGVSTLIDVVRAEGR